MDVNYDDWGARIGWDSTRPTDISSRPAADASGSLAPFTFLILILVLTGLGLIMMYSASYDVALREGVPHYYYALRQAIFACAACACFPIFRFLPIRSFKKLSPFLLVLTAGLMLLTLFTPFGRTVSGGRRWLQIGPLPSFQPSEMVKPAVILFLSFWFAREVKGRTHKLLHFLVPCLVVVVFAGLILMQRAYTTAALFTGISLSLFIAAGMGLGMLLFFVAAIGVPALIFLLGAPYRVRRIAAFIIPDLDPSGINWQVTNSLKAIQSGGWWGKGLGNSEYKLGLIPEVNTDFIFAVVAEETGFIGILFIFFLFFLFGLLGYRTYARMKDIDRGLAYVAFGITTMVIWQALVNVAVVTGALPPTGIPLPFFSQGGTNLFVILCECFLLYRIMLIAGGRIPLGRLSPKGKAAAGRDNAEVIPPGEEIWTGAAGEMSDGR